MNQRSALRPVRLLLRDVAEKLGLLGIVFRLTERQRARKDVPERDDEGRPLPPASLMVSVSGEADWQAFLSTGKQHADILNACARDAGTSFHKAEAILDFGCGCGRILRHLPPERAAALHGCDINPQAIDWCTEHLPGQFEKTELTPPLPYSDRQFDLIYLVSVFTHLREKTQQRWAGELARITKPGGVVLLTFHDEFFWRLPEFGIDQQTVETQGIVVRNDNLEGSNLLATYQSRAHLEALMSEHFECLNHRPADERLAQTVAILRRR
ncbi:MAG: class I SAM-dependent methyltransferase [Pseudomonadota bacterium]